MTDAIWVRFQKIAQHNADKVAIIDPASNKKVTYKELEISAKILPTVSQDARKER